MNLPIYQVDAFASGLFAGNPAAVIPLEFWIDDALMQKIAMENNLSETVFFVPEQMGGADFCIRWFTPESEINLCGHATLAAAFVLYKILHWEKDRIVFSSKSGLLTVVPETGGNLFRAGLDFPSWKPVRIFDYPEQLAAVLGTTEIVGVYKSRDWLVELNNEKEVGTCRPDFTLMKKYFDKIIITAPGSTVDFVSRFFAPGVGIDEDPVTGSAHAQLIPFWSEKLGKDNLHALQLSARGGELWCRQLSEERVYMAGEALHYMTGHIHLH